MANARTYDFISSLQELITDELDDPNPDRTGRWVYDTEITFSLPIYPRVHITDVTNNPDFFEISSTRRKDNNLIQCMIVVGTGTGNHLDIDDDEETERPSNVLDYLKANIEDLINDNQDRWRNLGDNSLNMVVDNDERVQITKDSLIAHVVEARIKNIR